MILISKRLTRKPLKFLCGKFCISIVFLISFGLTSLQAASALGTDEIGMYGSVLISAKADKAARALKSKRFEEAKILYKELTSDSPNEDDFYFGYYYSSRMLGSWRDVGSALKELFQSKPTLKDRMLIEYGECLFHLNRYTDAEPILRLALTKVETPSIVEKHINRIIHKGIIEHKPVIGKPATPVIVIHKRPKPRKPDDERTSHPATSDVDLNLKAAFLKSESILVAKFKKYDKRASVSFYQPPKAIYRIEKIIKGPPLNKTLPIRFEFHSKTDKGKPEGWKFDPKTMMPKAGSKWIIFIENSVPVDRMFETYHGCYGRIPYTDDTIDDVMRIVGQHKGQAN